MTDTLSWQSVLQQMIRSIVERQHLADALGVTPVTLLRWANGESKPQRNHLANLIKVVQPPYRLELIRALEESYPNILQWQRDEATEQVPASFFNQVLSTRANITEPLRFVRISDMVLTQALKQLDPHQEGMAVTLIQCMPPRADGKICSLRERAGKGTPPWLEDLNQLSALLGTESLAGHSVEVRHVVNVNDLSKDMVIPAYQFEHEVSAAANPIWFGGRIAGSLLASSTQIGHFTQQRLDLLETFSDLLSLALDKNDFHPPEIIRLRVMPYPEKQRPTLLTFRQRTQNNLRQPGTRNLMQAELKAWQEIEEILLNMPHEEEEEEKLFLFSHMSKSHL